MPSKVQSLFLQRILPLASQNKLPLVALSRTRKWGCFRKVRCRGVLRDDSEQVIGSFENSQALFHWVCGRDAQVAEEFFNSIVRLFGFASKSLTNPVTCTALAHSGNLAETDSPHFWKSRLSSPWELYKVNTSIYEIKNIPMSVLTKVLTKNTRGMYLCKLEALYS